MICDWPGRDFLGQSVKCLKQENRLDMIGWDNISRCDLRAISNMKMSKVKHRGALDEPKARLVLLKEAVSSICLYLYAWSLLNCRAWLLVYQFFSSTDILNDVNLVWN